MNQFFYSKNHQRAESHRLRMRRGRKKRSSVALEALEPRIFLARDPMLFAIGIVAADVTVKGDDTLTPTVQIVDNSSGNIVRSRALSETSEVVVTGSDQSDALTVDASAVSLLPITFDGGAGNDTLFGPSNDTTWPIIGAGNIDIENLQGAADNEDRFVFAADGGVSGLVEGRDAGSSGFDRQVVFLSFNGSEDVDYDGPIFIEDIDIAAFEAPVGLEGRRSEIIASVLAALERGFASIGIVFTTERPSEGEYTTLYIGGNGEAFSDYGLFIGVSEKVDVGNKDHGDIAFIFSDNISRAGIDGALYDEMLAGYAAHELGHLLGFEHAHTVGADHNPLAEVAFIPRTHVEIGKDVRDDVIRDGKLTIVGNEYIVHPKIVEALRKYPSHYYAGAVGPDAFPDTIYGQAIIHPMDTGIWLQRLLDMAWASQTDPAWTPEERVQNLSFAYGFLTHAAGDAIAHSLVNEFTEGVFPSVSVANLQDPRDVANAVRHFMVEAYIGDATPGADRDARRTLLADGDITDNASHETSYSVPARFVYEALLKPFSGDPVAAADTGRLQLTVTALAAPGTGTFRRSDGGDFKADGFASGMEIHAFGFGNAANNGRFQVVSDLSGPGPFNELTVARLTDGLTPAPLVGETGNGDEALVTQGSRGDLLDRFYDMRRVVSAQEQVALAAYLLAFPAEPPPGSNLEVLLTALGGGEPTPQQSAELLYAYLNDWREELDDGIRNWSTVGLAIAKGLFDSQARRDVQNEEGANVGIDVDPRRADVEAGIGLGDVLLAVLDDPNLDDDFSDSFITKHLLPMFGVPQFAADFRTPLNVFSEFIDDNIVGPVRLALNPITSVIDDLEEIPKEFIKDLIFETYGIDVDQLDVLLTLNNKMDVAFVTINGEQLPVFKPGDHKKVDGYMGIQGIAQSETLQKSLQDIPWITFYEDPTVALGSNVEFDKNTFAGYANSVQLTKLLLLVEDPIDGEMVGAGQLSALMTDFTGAPYEWSLLNMNGNHGGNIFTTTLQKPGQTVEIVSEDGKVKIAPVDERPWAKLIDGGSWRDDIITTTTILFRVTPSESQGAAAANAVWTANVAAGQGYHVQVSWLANVTQQFVNPVSPAGNRVDFEPASNATYRVFDGLASVTPIAEIGNINQRDFNRDYVDGDVTFDYLREIDTGLVSISVDAANQRFVSGDVDFVAAGFQVGDVIHAAGFKKNAGAYTIAAVQPGFIEVEEALKPGDEEANDNESLVKRLVVQITTGVLRVELANVGDGHVIAGPVRIEPVAGGPGQRVQLARDPQSLTDLEDLGGPQDGYEETGATWVDLSFPAGSGNFPLWESELLRSAYRALFIDWQNGTLQWPDLGDATSPDPNHSRFAPGTYLPDATIPNLATPFDLRPTAPPPGARVEIIPRIEVTGGKVRTFAGDVMINGITGDGDGVLDSLRIVATTGEVRIAGDVGGLGLTSLQILAKSIVIDPGVLISLTGDVTFHAVDTENVEWSFADATFQGIKSAASIVVGEAAIIRGRDIILETDSSTLKSAMLTLAVDPANPSGLEAQINEDELVVISQLAAAVIAESRSAINVRAGARLNATRDVFLLADALAEAGITTNSPGPYLGVTYGSASPTAEILVEEGVVISALEDVEVSAAAGNTLAVSTAVPDASEIVHFSISYGKARTTSIVEIRAGASVTAQNASFRADNSNSYSDMASADGFTASSGPGLGATFVLGSYQSSATAEVAAAVNVSGDLSIEAESIEIKNENRAFGQVSDSLTPTPFLEALEEFLGSLDLGGLIGTDLDLDPSVILPDVTIGAAVVLAETENKAAALLNDGAFVTVGDTLTIDSFAEEHYQASAVANAADNTSVGIGGAVAVSRGGNQATSFIGPNAVVDVFGDITLESDAVVTNPIPVFDPAITLDPVSGAEGTDRLGDEYDRADAVSGQFTDAFDGLGDFLTPFLANAGLLGNSFVHAGGELPPGEEGEEVVAIAGGVNILDIYNQAASGVSAGAKVNQRGLAAAEDQDVLLNANGTVQVAVLAGLDSAINLGTPAGTADAVGGYFNGLFADNYARAYLDDRATVGAAHDVSLSSLTTDNLLSVVEAGGEAEDVGINGAGSLVILGQESLAYIEDRADVTAGRDVMLDADNHGVIVNSAGGVPSGENVGVGLSGAFTLVNEARALDEGGADEEELDGHSKTHAFIGDSLAAVGPLGTGGETGTVVAGDDIALDADNSLEAWSVALAGKATNDPFVPLGSAEQSGGYAFGLGISGDVAFNQLDYTVQSYVRDVALAQAGDLISVEADDNPTLGAGAGAVVFADHVGIGGSLAFNGQDAITRAYTQDGTLVTPNLTIDADANDEVITLSRGGSGANKTLSVAGSVNLHGIDNTAEAAVGARTIAQTPNIDLHADSTLRSLSAAGAASRETTGIGAFGAALDLGTLRNAAYAYIGDEAVVDLPEDVIVRADTHEEILSVVAAMLELTDGPDNRLYLNNERETPFSSATVGSDVGGDETLTSDVALGDIDGDHDRDLVTGAFGQFNRRYLNDGSGKFSDGRDIGGLFDVVGEAVSDLLGFSLPDIDPKSLIPDLTLDIALEDVNGDGDLDVIAGNLAREVSPGTFTPSNRLYENRGNGTFLPAVEIGARSFDIAINPVAAPEAPASVNNNVTVADLLADLQTQLDKVIGLPGIVRPLLTPEGRIDFVSDTLTLEGEGALENAIHAARRDGLLETALNFNLVFDGTNVGVSINPANTAGNRTPEDLRRQLQGLVDTALDAAPVGSAGDVSVQINANGRIVFVLGVAGHTLGDTTSIENDIANARRAGRLRTEENKPISGTLTLSDADRTTSIAFADLDDDGDLDIVAGNFGEPSRFYLNDNDSIGDTRAASDALNTVRVGNTLIDATVPVEGQVIAFDLPYNGQTPKVSITAADTLANTSQADLIADVQQAVDAALEVQGLGAPGDIIVGMNGVGTFTFTPASNNGSGRFSVGQIVSTNADYTTAVALADVNGDDFPDLIAGNVGFDLAALLQAGVVQVADFVESLVINVVDLVESGFVKLLDVIEAGLIDRFGFDPLAPVSIGDLSNAGIAALADLVREGVLAAEDFSDIPLDPDDLVASGLVTQAELLANNLIDLAGNVSLNDLIASGIVFLEELVSDDLVDESALNVSDVTLGELLDSPLTDIVELVAAGLAEVGDLLTTVVDLRDLIKSQIVSLADLAEADLLDLLDLDQRVVDFQNLLQQFAFGGPTKIYFNDGAGAFMPAVQLSGDQFITTSLAVGDVDEDGDLDVVVANADAGSRLYLNNGGGTFGFSATISEPAHFTSDVLLADMNGEGHLDLVAAHIGFANRLYLGEGAGTFGGGTDISSDTNRTSSIAAGDVNGDGSLDVVAGDSSFPVAGSASRFDVVIDSKAYIGAAADVRSDRSVQVIAEDLAHVVVLAGADVGSNTSSIGLSAASPNIVRRIEAYVLGDVLPAQGGGFAGPQELLVQAIAKDDVLTYAAGVGSAGNLGVAASASAPRMDSEIDAYIGEGATVTVRNPDTTQALGVRVIADHFTDSLGVAGTFVGSLQQGIGAAADLKLLDKRVHAHIDPGAVVDVQNDVVIQAESHEHPDSIVAGLTETLDIGIAGSVAFTKLDKETFAFIDGANVRADGNIALKADGSTRFDPLVGAGALGIVGGVGFSGSLLMKADDTRAYITGAANVNALAIRDMVEVYTGQRDIAGNRMTRNVRGVALSATNRDDVDPLAVGGALALLFAAAGSGAGVITDNHVAAYVDAGVVDESVDTRPRVNEDDVGAARAQTVHLFAWDDTKLRSEEGVISAALLAAASATFDYAKLGKNTEAYIGENALVDSRSDVEILAHSTEEVRSIGGSSAQGFALFSGTLVGAFQTIAAETRAYTQRGARVRAENDVIVAADNDSEIEVIAGFQTRTLPNLVSGQILIGESDVGGKTEAYVDGNVVANTLVVTAQSDNRSETTAALNGLHDSLANIAAILPKAKTSMQASASLGAEADVDVDGTFTLTANSDNFARASVFGIAIERISIAFLSPESEAGGATRVSVGEGATVDALSFNPTAQADNVADSDITFGTLNVADIDIGSPRATTAHTVEAYFGPKEGDAENDALTGSITVANGGVTLTAANHSDASVNEVDVELSAVSYSAIKPAVEVGGATRAYLGGNFTFDADFLTARANAVNNADSDSLQVALSIVDLDFPERSATVSHITESYMRDGADISLGRAGGRRGGGLTLDADADNHAESGGVEIALATADVDILQATVTVRGSTSAYIGEGADIVANSLILTADADNHAEGDTFALGNATASIRSAKAEALTEHTTQAFIGRGRTDGVLGTIGVGEGSVTVDATSRNNAEIDDIDVGFATVDVDIVRPKADVKGATLASLGSAYVMQAGAVGVRADSTNTASSNAINIEASGIVAVDDPTTTIATQHTTEAFVAGRADLTVQGGGLTLDADSTSIAEAGEVGVRIGAVDIDAAETNTRVAGATRAYIGEGAAVDADTLAAAATSDNDATADAVIVGLSGVQVEVATSIATTDHTTEAYIGPDHSVAPVGGLAGTITVEEGMLTATSTNDASVDDIDIGPGGVTIEVIRPHVTTGGATRAFLAGSFTVDAATLNATADSTNNSISDALNIELVGVGIEVPTADVKTTHQTEAFVADQAVITMVAFLPPEGEDPVIAGDLALSATSANTAATGSLDVTLAGVAVAESDSTMIAGGATRAFVGQGASVKADSLGVTATSDNDAQSDTVFVNATGVKVNVAKAKASTQHATEAFIGPGAGVAPNDALSGTITVTSAGITLDASSTNDANISEIGVEIGGAVVDIVRPAVMVLGATRVFLGGHFTIDADSVTALANATNTATSDAVSIDVAGVAVDLPTVATETAHTTEAYVARQGDLRIAGGAVDLNATSTNTAEAGRVDIGLGGVDIALVKPHATAGGATLAYVDEGAHLTAGGLNATANATTAATVDTTLIGSTGIGVEIVRPTAETAHAAEAYVGPRAGVAPTAGLAGSIAVGGGTVSLNATSDNTADIDQFSISVAGIDVDTVRPEVTAGGTTQAHLGGNFTIGAGAVNVTASAPDNRARSEVFALDIGAVNVGEATAPVKVAHVTESFVADGGDVTVSGGPLAFLGTSTGHATADTLDISIGALDIAALSADARVEGATRSYVGANAVLNAGDASFTAQSIGNTALADENEVSVGLLDIVVLNPTGNVAHAVEAFVDVGADVTAADVGLTARYEASAKSDLDRTGVGLVEVTSVNPTAGVQGKTKAFVDGTVGSQDLALLADATRNATSDAVTANVGILGSGSEADSTAETGGDTEAYFGSTARITASGNVTANALAANQAIAGSETGSGGFIDIAFLDSTATVEGATRAFVDADAQVLQAANFELEAVAVSNAKSDTTVGSGGAIEVRGAQATANVTPAVEAYVQSGVSMTGVGGNLTVRADSVRAEGDATAQSFGGGVVDVGAARTDTMVTPTVDAYIATGAVIDVGGSVLVEAFARTQPSQPFGDTFTPDQATIDQDTITFANHGLSGGDKVTYNPNGNAAIATEDGGTLSTTREYSVIPTGNATLQLGATFNAQAANTGDLFAPAAGVDSERDRIHFSVLHGFETGDAVKYDAAGTPISTGLDETGTFFVRKLDDLTIKLYATRNEAIGAPGLADRAFGPGGVDATDDEITIFGHGFADNLAVQYRAAPPREFRSNVVDVTVSGSTFTDVDNDRIFLDNHGLTNGTRVIYRNSANADAMGLTVGTAYYVSVIDADNIQLAATPEATDPDDADDDVPITPIPLTPDKSTDGQKVRHALVRESIGGLEDGKTYYVRNPTANTFQLAATSGGAPIATLDGANRFGTHFIGRAGLELTGQSGAHTLRLDLTSAPGGQHLLLGPGGLSLRTLSPPRGDGQSSGSAQGGGGGFIEYGHPDSALTLTQNVQAFIAPALLQADGDVTVRSISASDTSGHAANAGGGFVAVGDATATNTINHSNRAYIGTDSGGIVADGVVIEAAGHLSVMSDSSLDSFVNSDTEGGGFVADVDAVSTGSLGDATQAVVGTNARVTARSVELLSQWSHLAFDYRSEADATGVFGDADATSTGNVNPSATTAIRGGAAVTGFEGVDLRALNRGPGISEDVDGDFDGISDGEEHPEANYNASALIDGDDGALVTAGPRLFRGPGVPASDMTPLEQPAGFDRLALYAEIDAHDGSRQIHWDSGVLLLSGPSPTLVVGPDGRIVKAINVNVVGAGNAIGANLDPDDNGTFEVDDTSNDNDRGQALFRSNDSGNSVIQTALPNGPVFTFRETYEQVNILNQSVKNVVINDIEVVNTIPTTPELEVIIEVDHVDDFEFDVAHDFKPSHITIQNTNTSPDSSPDITFAGLVNNPIGMTDVFNARGDVVSSGGVVRTDSFAIGAQAGSVGVNDAQRLRLEVVESNDGPTDPLDRYRTANADGAVFMELRALFRREFVGAEATTGFVVDIQRIRSGSANVVNLEVLRFFVQPIVIRFDYTIDVHEPVVVNTPVNPPGPPGVPPRTTLVINHFRESPGFTPTIFRRGVFGTSRIIE